MAYLNKQNPWANIPSPSLPRFFNRKKVTGTVSQIFVWLVDTNGRKGLGIEFANSIKEDFSCLKLKNLQFTVQPDGKTLTIMLSDEAILRQFRIFCEDCIETIENAAAISSIQVLQVLTVTVTRWADLFKKPSKNFTSSMEIGVFGELSFLNEVLTKKFSLSECIRGWRGPKGDEQDFLLNASLIEIKSQMASRDRVVKIASLDQLDTSSGQIYLVHYGFSEASQSRPNAYALPELVDDILSGLKGDNYAIDSFLGKLELVNYVHGVTESSKIFIPSFLNFFKVDDSFPKIVKKNVHGAIDRAEYRLNMSVLTSWQISETKLLQEIYR